MNGNIVSDFGALGLWQGMARGGAGEGSARGTGSGVGEVAEARRGEVDEQGTGQTE